MNFSAIYILIVLVALAAIAFLFFLVNPATQQKRLSLLASLSFAFIVGGILFGEERMIRSVASLTRKDGEEFLKLVPQVPIRAEIQTYSLDQANNALNDLRNGKVHGAAVLVMNNGR